jgi:uncharacterized protein YxeA
MKKYITIALTLLMIILCIWLYIKIRDRNKIIIKDDYVPKKEQSIEVAKRNTLDSIALERAMDSIQILNNMIANNVQKVKYIKVKSNEKANTVSTWSSDQFNGYLSDRYKDRK